MWVRHRAGHFQRFAIVTAVTAMLVGLAIPGTAVPAGAATSASGGSLTFGEVAGITSLDPIHIAGGGTSGGSEAGAVYGYLMRYDTETNSYVPYLAQSLTHNADFTQWTLKLRPKMTFSDGTPFDSNAVVQNFQRDMDPSKHATAGGILHLIQSINAPDVTTVDFTLTEPWSGFPFVLAYTPGAIAAPSYIAQVDAGNANATAIGAGPFKVASFQPGEALTLTPNTSYALAKPKLSSLKFVFIPGGPATLQAFQSGQLQSALLIDAPSVAEAETNGINALVTKFDLGTIVLMNNRTTSPLANPKLREAVSLAFNDQVFNERVNQGTGPTSTLIFPKGSKWYSSTEKAIPYDLNKARSLVSQVKATGWNGSLNMVCPNVEQSTPVAVESMLDAIGIKLNVTDSAPLTTTELQVIVDKNFDLACWGYNVIDDQP
ncbi:MAG TPA: ABC transporter substrate-binding protein, partial [Acidimicrobiales bacterium]